MWWSEHSLLLQQVRQRVAAADVAAVPDAVEEEQREVEQLQLRQAVQQYRQVRRQLTQAVVAAAVRLAAADVALVAEVTRFPRFADPQLSRGFHFSRGLQPSMTTTRQTR